MASPSETGTFTIAYRMVGGASITFNDTGSGMSVFLIGESSGPKQGDRQADERPAPPGGQLRDGPAAQGRRSRFSFPIHLGEAGIYTDGAGRHYVPVRRIVTPEAGLDAL